jgi:hypothetical protein
MIASRCTSKITTTAEASHFFGKLFHLLSKCGPHLQAVALIDNQGSLLFSQAHQLLCVLSKYARGLKVVKMAGVQENPYCEDSNILLLTSSCADVEEYIDGQAFGVTLTVLFVCIHGYSDYNQLCTIQAINMMVDGWSNLKKLTLNTEAQDPTELGMIVSQFRQRLHSLTVTHFRISLVEDPDTWGSFCQSLKYLRNLKQFGIDQQLTTHRDGLLPQHWRVLMEYCPSLERVQHWSCKEAYFTDDQLVKEDEVDSAVSVGSWSSREDALVLRKRLTESPGSPCPPSPSKLSYFQIMESNVLEFKNRNVKLLLHWI